MFRVSVYYGTPVIDIMKYRGAGNSFKWIIKNQHANKYKVKVKAKNKNQGQGQGKGQGKGNKKK